jgi:protoporphyrinogen oxidase
MNIGIVGAGFTGLTSAFELSKMGHKITIFEKESYIGGLAASIKLEGSYIENVYHHIFKTDTDIINLIEELGIKDSLKWCKSSMGIYYDNKLCPFVTPIDLLKFPSISLIDKIRLGSTILYLQKTKDWGKFKKITACKWMKNRCGKKTYDIIWKPLLKGKFHYYYDKISMAWLWSRLHIRANSKEKGSEESLGYLNGGAALLINSLVNIIKKSNTNIFLNKKVTEVFSDNDQTCLIAENKKFNFDKIIFTIPSKNFANLIEAKTENLRLYKNKLLSINYLDVLSLVFSSKQSLNPFYWVNINDVKSPFLAFIQHTNLVPKEWYNNYHIYYLATYLSSDHQYFKLSDEEIAKKFFLYLKKIVPEFSKNLIHQYKIIRMKNAQHIVDINYEQKKPTYVTPIPNVYLSNFSQIYPEDRGMNYAIREGKKIANVVLNK